MSRLAKVGVAVLIVGVIGLLVSYLLRPSPAEQAKQIMPDGKMAPAVRANFIASFIQSCMEQRPGGFPMEQFRSYCACMSEKGADAITSDEAAYLAASNTPPQSLQDKLKSLVPSCLPADLPKPNQN